MKTNEIHLIDRAALHRLCDQYPNLSRLQLAQMLIGQLEECLQETRQEEEEAPIERNLSQLARLRPTDKQLRRALLRLLDRRDSVTHHPLLCKKTHWLAVCRVLEHIEAIDSGRGRWKALEQLVNQLLCDRKNMYPACDRHDVCRKASEKMFNQPLTGWSRYSNRPEMTTYWDISCAFLHLIAEECGQKYML